MALSPTLDALIKEFETEHVVSSDGSPLSVSRTISALAYLYEKVRNAVEFRADHLVRRASIERILKRRMIVSVGSNPIAENLVIELLWARYIDSSLITDEKINKIQMIIDRYRIARQNVPAQWLKTGHNTWDDILGYASSEIEEILVSSKKRDALTNFVYSAFRPKIKFSENDQERANVLTYIAVERAYAQSDTALIGYHLLLLIDPEWFTISAPSKERTAIFFQHVHTVKSYIHDPIVDPMYRYMRKRIPPYLLIRDLFFESGQKIRETIDNRSELTHKLEEIATHRYQEIGTKVRRAIVRSFIYIFLTKMIFALALEAPYDLYLAKKIAYIPLIINMVFPPVLIALLAGLIAVPGQDNTRRLIVRIEKILFDLDALATETDSFSPTVKVKRPFLSGIFSLLYFGAFLITFGLSHMGLKALHFSIASETIFYFFVALVTFFAYRIRESAKEYEMLDRQGVLEPLLDFFFLPVLRLGSILSKEIARLNIFIFIFDFILEAPLKVIFEVIEEWIRFIRLKREEIV